MLNNLDTNKNSEMNKIYDRLTEIFGELMYNKNLTLAERENYNQERLRLLTYMTEIN
ncbi:MAG: hypothetical protein R3Y29_07880 [bacterium]